MAQSQLKIVKPLSIMMQARLAIAEYRAEQQGRRRLTDEEIKAADEAVIVETIRGEVTIDHYLDWRKQFTWRNVFESKTGLNLSGAARSAKEAGYRFVAHEGSVYLVTYRGEVEDTGLLVSEIE